VPVDWAEADVLQVSLVLESAPVEGPASIPCRAATVVKNYATWQRSFVAWSPGRRPSTSIVIPISADPKAGEPGPRLPHPRRRRSGARDAGSMPSGRSSP
jgi:hypothetical protein